MNLIFSKLVKLVGIEWVLGKAWYIAYPILLEKAKNTKTEVDDKALEIVNEVMKVILSKDDNKAA